MKEAKSTINAYMLNNIENDIEYVLENVACLGKADSSIDTVISAIEMLASPDSEYAQN